MTLLALVGVVSGLGLITTLAVRLAVPRPAERRPPGERRPKH